MYLLASAKVLGQNVTEALEMKVFYFCERREKREVPDPLLRVRPVI